MSKLLFVVSFLSLVHSHAQKIISREFGFITDNDLYVSTTRDEYYTNGLEIFYKKAVDTHFKGFDKKIHSLNIGQKIYNPFNPAVLSLNEHDRPFAGYTYATYQQRFANTKHIISLGFTVGYTGKKTGAKEAQEFIHDLYKLEEIVGFQHQIKQQIGAELHLKYHRNLLNTDANLVQISSIHELNAGSIFANIQNGLAFKLRHSKTKKTEISNSLFYGTSLATQNSSWIKERFLGLKSYLSYQLKDETVTGELHNNFLNRSFDIVPWVWHTEIGYYWNLKRWNLSYQQVFHTKNVQQIETDWIRYGSIRISYKF